MRHTHGITASHQVHHAKQGQDRGSKGAAAHEADEAVSHEDEVTLLCLSVAHDRMHPPHLECAHEHVQVGVFAQQHVAHNMAPQMPDHQVHRHQIVPPLPRDDNIGGTSARCNKFVVRGLDKTRVLVNNTGDVTAPLCDVAFDAPSEPYVVVRVDKDLHVRAF